MPHKTCDKCKNIGCLFVEFTFEFSNIHGNLCCRCIAEEQRTRVCKNCYIKGIEIYGGK